MPTSDPSNQAPDLAQVVVDFTDLSLALNSLSSELDFASQKAARVADDLVRACNRREKADAQHPRRPVR
jgi:hypothetical protein